VRRLLLIALFLSCAAWLPGAPGAPGAWAASAEQLSPAQKKNLDTFFSNFSEAGLKSFKQGELAPAALLDFALRHVYINRFKALKRSKDGVFVLASAELVDTATIKYFGVKLPSHAKREYPIPLADGEAYTFSQITSMSSLGGDVYQADGVIYSTGSGFTLDPHAPPAQWKKAGEQVDVLGAFRAKIKAESERYILLEYATTPKNK